MRCDESRRVSRVDGVLVSRVWSRISVGMFYRCVSVVVSEWYSMRDCTRCSAWAAVRVRGSGCSRMRWRARGSACWVPYAPCGRGVRARVSYACPKTECVCMWYARAPGPRSRGESRSVLRTQHLITPHHTTTHTPHTSQGPTHKSSRGSH